MLTSTVIDLRVVNVRKLTLNTPQLKSLVLSDNSDFNKLEILHSIDDSAQCLRKTMLTLLSPQEIFQKRIISYKEL